MIKPRVVIVGGDHYNMLGVIRSLGKDYDINAIIISDDNYSFCNKSKYVNKSVVIKNDVNMILKKIKEFADKEVKSFLIPTSDLTACIIDENYNELKKFYYTNNINDEQNQIIKYMDKYQQKKLCEKLNINIAATFVVDLKNLNKTSSYKFPCILKPIVSAYGEKSDIMIVNSEEELEIALKIFHKKKYKKVLYQEFLNIDEEIDVAGCADKGHIYIPGYIKKIHIYPPKKGSTTFGEVKPISKSDDFIEDVKKVVKTLGYNGIFDIDIFKVGNDFYFNEVNFRNGAISYAYNTKNTNVIKTWIKLISNKKKFQTIKRSHFFVEEINEYNLYKKKEITFLTFIKSVFKSKIKIYFSFKDCKPFLYKFINSVNRKLKK